MVEELNQDNFKS